MIIHYTYMYKWTWHLTWAKVVKTSLEQQSAAVTYSLQIWSELNMV